MKLKQRPDDFFVEELTDRVPGSAGPFSFYKLVKQSLGTPEAIQSLCRKLKVDSRRIRYGGLKDRHATTVQYISIEDGPKSNVKDEFWTLTYLGQLEEPYGPQSFRGNHFRIVLRDLEKTSVEELDQKIVEIKSGVVGNYFDDQRFGSVSSSRQFVARALIDGDEEKALKLALVEPYEHDRSTEKKAKKLLAGHWGDWKYLSESLPKGPSLSVTQYLKDRPEDYRGAFTKIPFFLKNMYLSAYQSHLWNRSLHTYFHLNFPAAQLILVSQKQADLWMPRILSDEQMTELLKLEVPLLSSRTQLGTNDPIWPSINSVLMEEGLELSAIKLKHYREPFFSKGSRAAVFIPEAFSHEWGWDKLQKGQRKLTLKFNLPRGSYATMVIKRLVHVR